MRPIGWRGADEALPCSWPTICHSGLKIGVSTPPGCTELQRMAYFCSAQWSATLLLSSRTAPLLAV